MFWDNLSAACEANGIKVTPLLQELSISTGNIGRWKKGGAVASDILITLSNRLGVSTDYLLTGKNDIVVTNSSELEPSSNALQCMSKDEQDLILMYRELPQQLRTLAFNYLKSSYDTYNIMTDSKGKSAV